MSATTDLIETLKFATDSGLKKLLSHPDASIVKLVKAESERREAFATAVARTT